MINLDALEPNKVSVDLSQYSMIWMGETGVGKTYTMNQFLRSIYDDGRVPLFLEFENRFQNIPGIMAIRINSIADLTSTISQLKNPKYKKKFSCIVIDTLDKYDEMCENYVLTNKNSEILKDIGQWNEGYERHRNVMRKIGELDNLGYTVHKIGQADITVDTKTDTTKVGLKLNKRTKKYNSESAYLIGYLTKDEKTGERFITFKRDANHPDLKDAFGLPEKINVNDLKDVWTEEIVKKNGDEVTKEITIDNSVPEDDFEALKDEAMQIAGELTEAGKYDNVMAVLQKNIGTDEAGNVLMFDSLLSTQTDLLKVIILELKDLK